MWLLSPEKPARRACVGIGLTGLHTVTAGLWQAQPGRRPALSGTHGARLKDLSLAWRTTLKVPFQRLLLIYF